MSKHITGRKLWALALTTGLLGAVAFAPAAHGKAVNITKSVGAPIPDRGPGGAVGIFGQLESTIVVPKQGKAKKVRDVNVTIQAAGAVGTTPISQLRFKLFGPGGQHTILWATNGSFLATNTVLGPFTADDESPLDVGSGTPNDPTQLFAPWSGSAAPDGLPLNVFDNGPAAGTWTLKVNDLTNGETSTLVSWALNVTPGKPFLTKVPK